MIEMWDLLVTEIDVLSPFYLPIDVPDRQGYLDSLCALLERPATADWTPQGSYHGNSELRHTDIDASPEVEGLCERIKPFLDRFY